MILKYLDLSTAHITHNDSLLLMKDIGLPFRVREHEYGYMIFMSLGVSDSDIQEASLSENFLDMWHYAQENDCTLINLDRDADNHPALHINDW